MQRRLTLNPLTLETDRLIIRAFSPGDLPVIHRILDQCFGDGSLVKDPAALEERRSWLEWTQLSEAWYAHLHQPPYGDRAITLKAGGAVIGAVGYVPLLEPFEQLPGWRSAEGIAPAHARFTAEVGLFWAVAPEHQRHGYASEAAQAMISYAFETLRLKRIAANTQHANIASQAVMLKVGMRLLRNPWPEPFWLQVLGVLDNPDGARG